MKKAIFGFALMGGLLVSVAAIADEVPQVGSTCISGCDALPNTNWSYGTAVVVDEDSRTGTTTETSSEVVNIANEKSGGKASQKNQSNFRTETTTTTTIEYTVTTTEEAKINPGGQDKTDQQGGPRTIEDVTYDNVTSETVEGDREHVNPKE